MKRMIVKVDTGPISGIRMNDIMVDIHNRLLDVFPDYRIVMLNENDRVKIEIQVID